VTAGDATKERSVSGVWRGGMACDVTAGEFSMRVDEPESVPGGSNTGPQPTEVFLASIASCFTLALAYSAGKRSLELDGIEVGVTGVYDGPSFSSIRIAASIGCDLDELGRLVAAAERVCYVTNTIRGGVPIEIAATSTRRS
jgi:putative redox protein